MNDSASQRTFGTLELARTGLDGSGFAIPLGTRNRLSFMLFQIGEILAEIAEDRLADSGLDARGYCILATLAVDGPGTQHELARLLGKAPGVIVTDIDQLESSGFVQRNRDPEDRRRSRVTLTPAGERALARADELADTTIAELLGGLDRSELTQLRDLLTRGLALTDSQPT
jgi:MarR family transcriptional regulator, lower aerobic nicotinate degradation pathway regulator